jgi:hypothetical protein
MKGTITSDQAKIQVSSLPPAMYFLEVKDRNGEILRKQLIKR